MIQLKNLSITLRGNGTFSLEDLAQTKPLFDIHRPETAYARLGLPLHRDEKWVLNQESIVLRGVPVDQVLDNVTVEGNVISHGGTQAGVEITSGSTFAQVEGSWYVFLRTRVKPESLVLALIPKEDGRGTLEVHGSLADPQTLSGSLDPQMAIEVTSRRGQEMLRSEGISLELHDPGSGDLVRFIRYHLQRKVAELADYRDRTMRIASDIMKATESIDPHNPDEESIIPTLFPGDGYARYPQMTARIIRRANQALETLEEKYHE